MPFNLLGQEVNTVIVLGQEVDELYINDELVYNSYIGPASPVLITENGNYIAGVHFPANTALSICMVGGGGSGMSTTAGPNGGGYAGELIQDVATLGQGEIVSCAIGAGGLGVPADAVGNPGGVTSFGAYFTATGGGGGNNNGYLGRGDRHVSPCNGTVYMDGSFNIGYGGQASAFANGADGTPNGGSGTAATLGAGGGGTYGNYSGNGGSGQIAISWT